MLLIVTRPLAQATGWVHELQALGAHAQALPLIEIAPAADPEPVRQAWRRLPRFDLVMFVSANAVAQFFALTPPGARWPADLQAASTGPGTSAALRAAGVPAVQIVEPAADATSFDSEALWAQLAARDWAGRNALVVRGEQGRDWLAEQLRERGATVEFVAAYRRQPPVLDGAGAALLARALAQPQAHLWLFSSSEAVAQLPSLAPHAHWQPSRAIASHARIAQAARGIGFGQVELVPPTPALVAQRAVVWPSLQSAAS